MPYKRYLFACLILLSVLPFAAHAAQSTNITLTVALADTTHGDPARLRSALDAFEVAHPGLKVAAAQTLVCTMVTLVLPHHGLASAGLHRAVHVIS